MSPVFVRGWGAVSPAGWGAPSLVQALEAGVGLATSELVRPGWQKTMRVRSVPKPEARPAFLAHPRLRRSSPVAHYTLAASIEAIGDDASRVADGSVRLGVVFCVMSGCVQYSRRFFDEVLRDPSTASPLVFPETVFNAPASHLSAFLGSSSENYTVVGDSTAFVHGLEIAAHWLGEGRVDGCLVVAAEELDWLTADAFRHFSRSVTCAEGAGAVYLAAAPANSTTVELDAVTDGIPFTDRVSVGDAIRLSAAGLPAAKGDELLVDGLRGAARLDRAEVAAWRDWQGPRVSPKSILGEALTASAAWQCVAACEAVASGKHPAARVSVVGPNAQAIAARFKSSRTSS